MHNGSTSSIKPVSIGVPRGSALELLLFLIYINDLNKCVKYSSLYQFVDDSSKIQSDSPLSNLSKRMNVDLNNWESMRMIFIGSAFLLLVLQEKSNFCQKKF